MGLVKKATKGLVARDQGYPYHTKTGEKRNVYHVLSDCPEGKKIETLDIRSGGFGRHLCDECQKLVAQRSPKAR